MVAVLMKKIIDRIAHHPLFILLALLLPALTHAASEQRIKDLAQIAGVRSNPLVGYGLVVGLDGTGEQTAYTEQSFKSMLSHFGIELPKNFSPKIKNVAAVAIHAELPPFIKPGQTIDVTVSSLGTAKSLRGGTLLMAPLKGINGQTYAIAQGNLIVGGFGAEGNDGSRISINIPTAGRIPNGAIVERIIPGGWQETAEIILNLHQPDFTTAKRLVDAVNATIGDQAAAAMDAASVRIAAPKSLHDRVQFIAMVEAIPLTPAESAARVVVNSRTGTIVMGDNIRVHRVAVSHGNLVVTVAEDFNVSQPDPLSNGETVVTNDSAIQVEAEEGRLFVMEAGISLQRIVKAMNAVGAAPGDVMAILEALKQSGALQAELVVI